MANTALPVLVLLDHYPRELDNEAGNRFAHVLSHVASACIAGHGPAVPTISLGTLVGQVEEHLRHGDAVSPPEEVRHNLVAAAGALLAMVRKYDDVFPLPSADPDEADDLEEELAASADRICAQHVVTRGEVEHQLRTAVGLRLDPPRGAAFVAPRAQLRRLGFSVPDFEALEALVAETWGLPLTIPTDCTTAAIADAVCEALNRRNAA